MTSPILVFARALPDHHVGGMETLTWDLAAEWTRVGHRVRIVTTSIPGQPASFVRDGVEVVPLDGTGPGRYSRAWWRASRAYWTALDTAPSAVLSVSAGAYSVVPHRSRHRQTPFVMQAHGTSAMEIASKLRARSLRSFVTAPKNVLAMPGDFLRYRGFDQIVAVGDSVAESLAALPQRWAVRQDRVSVIRNGVRGDRYAYDPRARAGVRERFGIPDSALVVACVGRLHVQKRLDRALRAVAALRDRPNVDSPRLLIVGDGPDEGRLRGLGAALHVADLVHFIGRVHPSEAAAYYSAADVGLLTTARREVGLPLAALEALAGGLPCVVPRGLVPEPFDDGLHTADVDDAADVATALSAAAQPSTARTTLLPAELTIEHCAQRYVTLFESLAAVSRS